MSIAGDEWYVLCLIGTSTGYVMMKDPQGAQRDRPARPQRCENAAGGLFQHPVKSSVRMPIEKQGESPFGLSMVCYTTCKGQGLPGRSRWEVPFLAAIHSANSSVH